MLSLRLLKQHLQSKPVVSLQELETMLQEDSTTICCLLKHFIDRGCVTERPLTANCGTRCQKCPLAATKLYSWNS